MEIFLNWWGLQTGRGATFLFQCYLYVAQEKQDGIFG